MTDTVDPSVPDAFTAALGWLEGTLLGTVATTIAILAIASVGFLMLTGRIDIRRAAQVVFGCFIIFGASTIASGIMGELTGSRANPDLDQASASPPPVLPEPRAYPKASATPYDPYAGAALPPR
jgi:type IV secretory pathway VirB2 component (pilin)